MAEAAPYDAVVLDVMLPDLDGFAVLRRLREREVWTPVLMLTARDAVGDRVGGLDAGADDYLTKPFSFAELLARLRAIVRRGAGRAPDDDRGRRPPARSGGASRLARRDRARALDARVRAARAVHAARRVVRSRGSSCSTAPGTWRSRAARTSSTSTSATCARRSTGRSAASRSRRCAASATGCARRRRSMSRLPDPRLRLTLPFALAMARVLAAMGALHLPPRRRRRCSRRVDQNLSAQVAEATAQRRRARHSLIDQDVSIGPTIAQLVRADGTVAESEPPAAAAAGRAARSTGAHDGVDGRSPGCAATWRVEVAPVAARRRAGDARRRPLARGARRDAATASAHEFLLAAPVALLLALARRLRPRGGGAAPGRGDAPPRGRRHRGDAGPPAAGPARARRDLGARGHAERHARAARGVVRARAPVRRRREPRAAHAARAAPRRARARARAGRARATSSRRAALGSRGDRAALAARRGPAADRPRRPGPAADPAGAAAGPTSSSTVSERASPRRAASLGRGARGRRPATTRAASPTRCGSSRRSATSSTTRSSTAPGIVTLGAPRRRRPRRAARRRRGRRASRRTSSPRAFDRFSRADDGRSARRASGSGSRSSS